MSPRFDYASAEQMNEPVQKFCRDHGLTPYDALYVELAMRMKAGHRKLPGDRSIGTAGCFDSRVPEGRSSRDALLKHLVGIEAIAVYYLKPGGKMEIPV